MAKKRPTLDSFLNPQNESGNKTVSNGKSESKQAGTSKEKTQLSEQSPDKTAEPEVKLPQMIGKHEVVRHMLYLPLPVYDQLQALIFEEQRGKTKRRKVHDYLLESIDLLFEKKGLKSIKELTG